MIAEMMCRQGGTGDQTAAADRNEQAVEIRIFLKQLDAGRTLSEDHIDIVGGMQKRRSTLLHQSSRLVFSILRSRFTADDLPAVGPGRVYFNLRGGRGHGDAGRHARVSSGQRDRLGEITGRMRDHAPRFLVVRQASDRVAGPTNLERTGSLEILAFEEQRGSDFRIERTRCQHRSMMDKRSDAFIGRATIPFFRIHSLPASDIDHWSVFTLRFRRTSRDGRWGFAIVAANRKASAKKRPPVGGPEANCERPI